MHAAMWVLITLYGIASTGESVKNYRQRHIIVFWFFIVLGLCLQVNVILHAYKSWMFWSISLGTPIIIWLLRFPLGAGSLKGIFLIPLVFATPIMMCLQIQRAVVGVATSDCVKSGWETREKLSGEDNRSLLQRTDNANRMGEMKKAWTRSALMTTWLFLNFGFGQLILAFDAVEVFFAPLIVFFMVDLAVTMLGTLIYTGQSLTWTRFDQLSARQQNLAQDDESAIVLPEKPEVTTEKGGTQNSSTHFSSSSLEKSTQSSGH
jgi:hypothetical protein